ncbi:MAG TPA: glycosyltransferase family 2 protein, partial [Gaiellaceae bacterium]|nr:glycosyltransferase family 2 protein [Gaiellaceae bacterium]
MRVVLTLLTRDQADVVDAVVAFHLHAGACHVVAIDHRSRDGTDEILEAYERAGVLHLIRERGEHVRTREWRTAMARLAAERFSADWVVGADGDEFWWPRHGTLGRSLGAVPASHGVVDVPSRTFLPRPAGEERFEERMVYRLAPRAPLLHPNSPHKPDWKVAHRAERDVVVQGGSHRLLESALVPLHGWHPLEVLHFPVRSPAQLERRIAAWRRAGRAWRFERGAIRTAAEAFSSRLLRDEDAAAGVAAGTIVLDTRLRDLLRAVRRPDAPPAA